MILLENEFLKGRSNHQSIRHNHSHGWLVLFVLRFSVSLLLLCSSSTVKSIEHSADILIIKSSGAEVYDTVIAQLKQHLSKQCIPQNGACPHTNIETTTADKTRPSTKDFDLVITLGLKARTFADRHFSNSRIINAMIPTGNGDSSDKNTNVQNHPTLILDQPPIRSLLLIKYLMPNAERVGFLYTRENSDGVESLVKSAEEIGLKLIPTFVDDEAKVGKQLSQTFDKIDVLLALPDVKIHNRKHVTSILLSTYRNKIPLIGFSAAYVKAGALAAIYSTPENIGLQLAESIGKEFANQAIPTKVIYPKYFSVSINSRVAHSLAIQVPAESDKIEMLIRDMEK